MRIQGVLLAIEREPAPRVGVRLLVRDEDEQVHAFTDVTASPLLVARLETGADPRQLAARLRALEIRGHRVRRAFVDERRKAPDAAPESVVVVEPLDAAGVSGLAGAAGKVEGVAEVLEGDVDAAERYASLHDLRPFENVNVEADVDDRILHVERVPRKEPPPLRVLALEVALEVRGAVPDAAEDGLLALAWHDEDGSGVIEVESSAAPVPRSGEQPPGTVDGAPEAACLRKLVDLVNERDPDVLATHGGDAFLWPFLAERAKRHGIPLAIGRFEGILRLGGGRGAAGRAITVPGRPAVDLARLAARDLGDAVKLPTLANVLRHFGNDADVPALFEDAAEDASEATLTDVPRSVEEARRRARGVHALAQALLPLQVQYARMTRASLDVAARMGRGRQVEAILVDRALRNGLLVPNPPRESPSYTGGLVLEPVPGLHEDIVVLDFSSMYPTLMIRHNVGPDTHVPDPSPEEEAVLHVAPGVGHAFRREPPGLFRAILEDLVARRRAIRSRLRELPANHPDRSRLDAEQTAVKVFTNAFYGYTAWALARWHHLESAEATTAWGRELVSRVAKDAEDEGFEVLYGDTDSLFLKTPGAGLHPSIREFLETANETLPVELDVAAEYDVLLLSHAKKRYAALTRDGDLVVRGYESRRGDWCAAATKLQREVLRRVLEAKAPRAAVDVAREAVARVRRGDVAPADLVLWRTLTRPLERYEARQAHAEAARRAKETHPQMSFRPGTKVGYVVLGGKGPVHGRSKLASLLDAGDALDHAYYAEKQVKAAALRVLEPLGVAGSDLDARGSEQRSLEGFFP